MKVRNKRIYNANQAWLATIQEEYQMLGYDTELEPGCLTVFSRRRKKPKKKKEKHERDKRSEKFQKRV